MSTEVNEMIDKMIAYMASEFVKSGDRGKIEECLRDFYAIVAADREAQIRFASMTHNFWSKASRINEE